MNIQDIILDYSNGLNTVELSNKFGISRRKIVSLFKNLGIKIRTISESKYLSKSNFKYFCNENYFSVPNKDNCYWAGFIAADGYIGLQKTRKSGRKYLSIELANKDKYHLINFKEDIYSTHPISNCIKNCCKIKIFSNQMTNDLERNFNIVNKKTFIYKPPYLICEDLIRNFIRGYIDGDGCVKVKYNTIEIKGTYELLNQMKLWLIKYCDVSHKPKIGYTSGCRTLAFSGRLQFNKICKWLTINSNRMLFRKWNHCV